MVKDTGIEAFVPLTRRRIIADADLAELSMTEFFHVSEVADHDCLDARGHVHILGCEVASQVVVVIPFSLSRHAICEIFLHYLQVGTLDVGISVCSGVSQDEDGIPPRILLLSPHRIRQALILLGAIAKLGICAHDLNLTIAR